MKDVAEFRMIAGLSGWATNPRCQGFVAVAHTAAGRLPVDPARMPAGLHLLAGGVYELDVSPAEARTALLGAGFVEHAEAGPSAADLGKAAGLERAIEILRGSEAACGEFYHDGCGCQEHLVWGMQIEARTLRGEEI